MNFITVSNNQFQLNTKSTSYVMHRENGMLVHSYYGKRLPEGDHSYMTKRGRHTCDYLSNISDNIPALDNATLEYPAFGDGGIVFPVVEVLNSDGSNYADFRVTDYVIHEGKPKIEGLPASYAEEGDNVKTLEVKLIDKVSLVEASLFYAVFYDYDVITRWAKITNGGKNKITLLKALSANIAFDNNEYDVISNFGTWARERQIERTKLTHMGARISSNCGFSSSYANPFMIVCDHNATEFTGEAMGVALAYSGNHEINATLSRYNVVNLSAGIAHDSFRWNLENGQSFSTPEVVISFSANGFSTLSHNFHEVIRNRVCRGIYRDVKRPMLLNLWEGCYFDFTEETVKRAADSAAELGVEILVIDDGWFGHRNDEKTSLGDWYVNENKIRGGLKELCDYVNSKGLKLGIWFEPEMVSPDSDLYRTHPEWAMHIEGREATKLRWQWMLDLANPEVCDYIYDSIAAILKNANIEYIKWDCNRTLSHLGANYLKPEQMGEYFHRYMLGLYSILERLTKDFPYVLFEGCASGGGRFDMGMLYYMPQIWTSDDTDAAERTAIQYGTSFIYPMSCQSAHVSVCPNHQTGRTVTLEARHIFALTGSFGYELAPQKIVPEDREYIKEFIKFYNENFELFRSGKYYRLTNPQTDDYAVFEYANDQKVVVGAMRLGTHAVNLQYKIRLQGLEPERVYTDVKTGAKYLGAQLMEFGLQIPTAENVKDFGTFMWELC